MTHLRVTLKVETEGVQVVWRLAGARFEGGQPLAQLPLSIAGAPTIELDDEALSATDEAGPLGLLSALRTDADDEPVRRWSVDRATVGVITVAYLARPTRDEPRAATPPLELRREGSGSSGALKCFLVLPPGPEDLTFELAWDQPDGSGADDRWMAVSSLGEGFGVGG
jgi:hypothetical protein